MTKQDYEPRNPTCDGLVEGDECPLCQSGTVEVSGDEVVCRGERGSILPPMRILKFHGTCAAASFPDAFTAESAAAKRKLTMHHVEADDSTWCYVARQMAEGFAYDLYGHIGDQWDRDEYTRVTVAVSCEKESRTYEVDVALHIEVDMTAGEATLLG